MDWGLYVIEELFQYDTMFAIIVLISAISLLGMFSLTIKKTF